MSHTVVTEILHNSRTKGTTRSVLLVIGETAHHDGVAFGLPQAPRPKRKGKAESLAERANASVRSVERAIATAEALGELEIRKYRKGSRVLNVYRIVLGRLRDVEADHERLLEWDVVPERPFSTPEELALSLSSRPAKLAGRNEEPDPTDCPAQPDIPGGSTPAKLAGLTRESAEATHPEDSSRTHPGTSLSSKNEETEVEAAGAAPAQTIDDREELLRAFADELGRWPRDRGEWGAWHRAFKELSDKGASAESVRHACRSFRKRWPHLDLDSPFALQKTWMLLTASFEPSYFKLHRWITDSAWRLGDRDEIGWVLDRAPVDESERGRLADLYDEVEAAHLDEVSAFHRWVELEGWALDEQAWIKRLGEERGRLGTKGPDAIRDAQARRFQLRQTLGELRLGARDVA